MSEAVRDLDAETVAAWLRAHPAFFSQHPDVVMAQELPRMQGAATSLASYQLQLLRDRNRELNRRLQELFAIANDNERLTLQTHQLTLALLRARDLNETLTAVTASLREDFNSPWIRLLLEPRCGIESSPWWRQLDRNDTALLPFASVLAGDEPQCGRLSPERLQALFGDEAGQVQSAALLPLGRHGLLAIGSDDPNHFYPGMGTLFLRLMSEALVAALRCFER